MFQLKHLCITVKTRSPEEPSQSKLSFRRVALITSATPNQNRVLLRNDTLGPVPSAGLAPAAELEVCNKQLESVILAVFWWRVLYVTRVSAVEVLVVITVKALG